MDFNTIKNRCERKIVKLKNRLEHIYIGMAIQLVINSGCMIYCALWEIRILIQPLVILLFISCYWVVFFHIMDSNIRLIISQIQDYNHWQLIQNYPNFLSYQRLFISVFNMKSIYMYTKLLWIVTIMGYGVGCYQLLIKEIYLDGDIKNTYGWAIVYKYLVGQHIVVLILTLYLFRLGTKYGEYKLYPSGVEETQNQAMWHCILVIGYYALKCLINFLVVAIEPKQFSQLIVLLLSLAYSIVMCLFQALLLITLKQPLTGADQNQQCFECYFTLYQSMVFSERPAFRRFRIFIGILMLLNSVTSNIYEPVTNINYFCLHQNNEIDISFVLVTEQLITQIYIGYSLVVYLMMKFNKQEILKYDFDREKQIVFDQDNEKIMNEIRLKILQNYQPQIHQENNQLLNDEQQYNDDKILKVNSIFQVQNQPLQVFQTGNRQLQLGQYQVCYICIAELYDNNSKITLGCDLLHTFHKSCIQYWLTLYSVCPICREPVQIVI